jgi:Protein of unknown function (DUF3309)
LRGYPPPFRTRTHRTNLWGHPDYYATNKICITPPSVEISPNGEIKMLILLVILILVFGFGGYRMGPGLGYYGGGGISLILLIVLILLLLKVV